MKVCDFVFVLFICPRSSWVVCSIELTYLGKCHPQQPVAVKAKDAAEWLGFLWARLLAGAAGYCVQTFRCILQRKKTATQSAAFYPSNGDLVVTEKTRLQYVWFHRPLFDKHCVAHQSFQRTYGTSKLKHHSWGFFPFLAVYTSYDTWAKKGFTFFSPAHPCTFPVGKQNPQHDHISLNMGVCYFWGRTETNWRGRLGCQSLEW